MYSSSSLSGVEASDICLFLCVPAPFFVTGINAKCALVFLLTVRMIWVEKIFLFLELLQWEIILIHSKTQFCVEKKQF